MTIHQTALFFSFKYGGKRKTTNDINSGLEIEFTYIYIAGCPPLRRIADQAESIDRQTQFWQL